MSVLPLEHSLDSQNVSVETIDGDGPVQLICEHASGRLPDQWRWAGSDHRLDGVHWSVDVGIARLTRHLAAYLGAPAVLAGASRLLVDCNRTLTSDTLFRDVADGQVIGMNVGLSPREREARIRTAYEPYHDAVADSCRRTQPALVLSMHSYTPLYEGAPRTVQWGVLHDGEPELAEQWAIAYRNRLGDLEVAINEPWSGSGGYMFSAVDHAQRVGARAMELEIRNDLLVSDNMHRFCQAIGDVLAVSGFGRS